MGLQAIRKAFVHPITTAHRGRIVKTTGGGGILVEYVRCFREPGLGILFSIRLYLRRERWGWLCSAR
jgi:hypothetical protein